MATIGIMATTSSLTIIVAWSHKLSFFIVIQRKRGGYVVYQKMGYILHPNPANVPVWEHQCSHTYKYLTFYFFHHFSSHQAVLLYNITLMLKIGQFQLLFIPPGGKTCVSRMLVKFDHVCDITRPRETLWTN